MSDLWIIYCIVFAAVILAVQALYWLIVGAQRRSATLKRRLALSADRAASEPVDILRQERGLANFDHPRFARLNEFLAQTGLRISLFALGVWTASLGAMVALALSCGRLRRQVRSSARWLSWSTCQSFAGGGSI